MNFRILERKKWLDSYLGVDKYKLAAITGDASFRSYYRVISKTESIVLMDAPPDKEKPDVFYRVANLMRSYQLPVPECIKYQQELGFILLTDLGDQQLFHILNIDNMETWYKKSLKLINKVNSIEKSLVPPYEKEKLLSEMDLLPEWFFQLITYIPTIKAKQKFAIIKNFLATSALCQPQVFIHRDFHSKNLMVVDQNIVMIDFQDAVCGPITYDLVSLLKDCYISLPHKLQSIFLKKYYNTLQNKKLLINCDFNKFQKWFDWMGLQRHLKCLGIFSRLYIRDNKSDYLEHIPRICGYVEEVLDIYPEFMDFSKLWKKQIKPLLKTCDLIVKK